LSALFSLSADPWGKDSELAYPQSPSCLPAQNFAQKIGARLIQFHQDVISPADGPRSHFSPSSSQYTLEAIRRYGFLRGVALGCDRLQRENKEDWVYRTSTGNDGLKIKLDPLPNF